MIFEFNFLINIHLKYNACLKLIWLAQMRSINHQNPLKRKKRASLKCLQWQQSGDRRSQAPVQNLQIILINQCHSDKNFIHLN